MTKKRVLVFVLGQQIKQRTHRRTVAKFAQRLSGEKLHARAGIFQLFHQFQAGPLHIIIAQQAAGVGANLHFLIIHP